MAGVNMTARLEKKDNLIASLRETVTTLKAQNKELRAASRGKARTATAAAAGSAKRTRATKARTRARKRSTEATAAT